MRSLPQPGGVTTPADVAKGQLPGRVSRQRVRLNIRRIKSLLRDAIAQEHHPVAIPDKEISGKAGCNHAEKRGKESKSSSAQRSHKLQSYRGTADDGKYS